MAILCPQCDESVKPGDKQCPRCGEPLDVWSLLKRWRRHVGYKIKGTVLVRCPACSAPGSLKTGYCMKCGCNFTVAATLVPLLRGPRKVWDKLATNATPEKRRWLNLVYTLVSILIFVSSLLLYNKYRPEHWVAAAILTIPFLLLFLVLFLWLRRRPTAAEFEKQRLRARGLKLAFVFNYFTFLLLLQMLISVWLGEAIIVVIMFLVTLISFYVFFSVWGVWAAMAEAMRPTVEPDFDAGAPQGRRARYDRGGGSKHE